MHISLKNTFYKYLPVAIATVIALFILLIFLLPKEHYELFGSVVFLFTAFLTLAFIAIRWHIDLSANEENIEPHTSPDNYETNSSAKQVLGLASMPSYLVIAFLLMLLLASIGFRFFYL